MDIEPVNQRVASIALSQIASEMQEVQPYKTIIRGEPPIQDQPLNYKKSTDNQRCRTIIHALTRANEDGVRPDPSEQNIPSFIIMDSKHLCITNKVQPKRTSINHMTSPLTKLLCVIS